MIKIIGVNGEKKIHLPSDWKNMVAVSRVLWIHENHRDITEGKKFQVETCLS